MPVSEDKVQAARKGETRRCLSAAPSILPLRPLSFSLRRLTFTNATPGMESGTPQSGVPQSPQKLRLTVLPQSALSSLNTLGVPCVTLILSSLVLRL